MRKRSSERRTPVQNLLLYAASAAFSSAALFIGLRLLDPDRSNRKAIELKKKEIAKRIGRPIVQTNRYEDAMASDVIDPDHIDVTFESIGGLENIKQSLFDLVILPLQRPELFSHSKLLRPQKGILLYGPPGTGKTLLAKAIAKESGAVFINVMISNLMSKWFGDAQKLDNARVMVLGATNRPLELDAAILRRFAQNFEIGMPNQSERSKILNVILKGERVDNIDVDYVASLCDGFTGSDILELCKQAAYFSVRDFLQNEKNEQGLRALTQSDLEKSLSTIKMVRSALS